MLLDLVLGDADGLDLLRQMKQEAPDTKVILISAHGSIESAVTAMKLGGYDFIKKPFELEEIVAAVRNAVRTSAPRAAGRLPGGAGAQAQRRRGVRARGARDGPAARARWRSSPRAPCRLVLVTGESGTGKQAIARMLHEGSPRASGPFVELNCSAIPENLVESELFGHERGAFSDARERKLGLVEIADGGTLFLDEIGDLGAGAQAKLLTFLEQRTFRRVGATARAAGRRARRRRHQPRSAGRWSPRTPSARISSTASTPSPCTCRRCASGPPTCARWPSTSSAESAREFGRRFQAIAPETAGLLERYRWPGNVRELRAVIARAVLLHDDDRAAPGAPPGRAAWPRRWRRPARRSRRAGEPAAAIPTLEEIELGHIRRVLEICGGNRTLAAQHLGITRQTLAKKVGGTSDE